MLKPFYIKKKNINNRLVPPVSAADAGKVLGVTEEGKIAPVEGGGGGSSHIIFLDSISMTHTPLETSIDSNVLYSCHFRLDEEFTDIVNGYITEYGRDNLAVVPVTIPGYRSLLLAGVNPGIFESNIVYFNTGAQTVDDQYVYLVLLLYAYI